MAKSIRSKKKKQFRTIKRELMKPEENAKIEAVTSTLRGSIEVQKAVAPNCFERPVQAKESMDVEKPRARETDGDVDMSKKGRSRLGARKAIKKPIRALSVARKRPGSRRPSFRRK
eukprot:c11697_g1_i1.p1 GENE.c11697_g1_i1~~c11697_g1_i1.p1  ORF type:complete len:130 (+),score=19.38 c11697_g1_i1:43-390(+)